jgi:hypothetical protein
MLVGIISERRDLVLIGIISERRDLMLVGIISERRDLMLVGIISAIRAAIRAAAADIFFSMRASIPCFRYMVLSDI